MLAGITGGVRAQQGRGPSARVVSGSRLVLPGQIDSNVPMTWTLVDGVWRLFATTSWGGIPALLSGPGLEQMQRAGDLTLAPHPGHGVWIESILPDEGGTWYGFYHHEVAGDLCGTPDRSLLRIGAARSGDRGTTWEDLGVVLEGPPGSVACGTNNRFVLGGVGDLSALLDADHQDVYLYFSQYGRTPDAQGVAVARLAWADRDAPTGKVSVWRDGAWLPPVPVLDEQGLPAGWVYPSGTPLVPVTRPWHDGDQAADAYWGPSLHWNTYLERYVMLLNRTKDERFSNEGLYVSFAPALNDPGAWSAPRKIMDGGGWYPQVAGLEPNTGTDKVAGQRARFFVTGRSDWFIEFER